MSTPSPALRGVFRSLRLYRAEAHLLSLAAFLPEVAPGARLVFDIGAHAGDRVRAFRALGARVVAMEPNPLMLRALRLMHGRDDGVSLVGACAGAAQGRATLRLNTANPTVSTLAAGFTEAASGAPGWEGQVWDDALDVEVTTVAALAVAHGQPDFVKIDVEGFEAEVLRGVAEPPARLSFEIVTMARPAALEALEAAAALGYRRFRLTLGESHVWETDWLDRAGMEAKLRALPDRANSGDVVAAI
ncbi:MAG: FkbM family methyltransferase [Pikeienuella sp.]|uniref:FkbM family methyltransferase n=1 Tax=Pikeienuella sp. TaxID=2831957 RepID=UPI00391AD482